MGYLGIYFISSPHSSVVGGHLEPVVFLVSLRGSRLDARALWSIFLF